MLKIGDTFLLPKSTNPKNKKEAHHLWIVISEPESSPERRATCVNISSAYADSDRTVTLTVDDHRFVDRESIIFYADARVMPLNLVQQAIAKTSKIKAWMDDPISGTLLKRIQKGILDSPETPDDVVEYFESVTQIKNGPPVGSDVAKV